MKFRNFMNSVLLLMSLSTTVVAVGPFDDFTRKMKITFPGYDRPETLSNFPALVVMNECILEFRYEDFASPADGGDLRFADSTETIPLNYEIERWDTNTDSYVWLQVPEFSSNTWVWAYWGNPGATNPPACTTNGATWSDAYAAVWHLAELGVTDESTGDVHRDSTTNKNHGTQYRNASAQGCIAGAQRFDGANDYIDCGSDASLDIGPARTITAWIKPVVLKPFAGVVSKNSNRSVPNSYMMCSHNHGGLIAYASHANPKLRWRHTGDEGLGTGAWYHVAFSVTDTPDIYFYINGEFAWSRDFSHDDDPNDNVYIGSWNAALSVYDFDGLIDEVRISSGVRSTNWIWASYMNQVSNSMFSAYWVDTLQVGNLSPYNVTPTSATLAGEVVADGIGGGSPNVYICWGQHEAGTGSTDAWDRVECLGTNRGVGDVFSIDVGDLVEDRDYFYRCYATNATGRAWTDSAESFITGHIAVQAADGIATETAGDVATFTISRPAACTNATVVVYYDVDGTAANGQDYSSLSGYVILTDDATNATVVVKPIDDDAWDEETETVRLAVSFGGYAIASASNATVSILENDFSHGWRHGMTITFPGCDASSTLTNFPVLLIFHEGIKGFLYGGFLSDLGHDLRFTDAKSDIMLPYEIEHWNPNGASYIWVRVPLLTRSTEIAAHWGNPTEVDAPDVATNGATWADGFAGVWHLSETDNIDESNGAVHTDSTPNRNHGIQYNNAPVAGKIVGAQRFDGDWDYIECGDVTEFGPADWTVSVWLKTFTVPKNYVTSYDYSGDTQWGDKDWSVTEGLWGRNHGCPHFTEGYHTDIGYSTTRVDDDSWHLVTYTWNYEKQNARLYVDGVDDNAGSSFAGYPDRPGSRVLIGRGDNAWLDSFGEFLGSIDEVRISNATRSSNWVWTTWENVVAHDNFVDYEPWTLRESLILIVR